MAHETEPMDIDNDFDNKENTFNHNGLPCTEKGYEELDVSELNMKLRYSLTPTASPMSKSFNCAVNKTFDYDETLYEPNLTRSLNSSITKNEIKTPKTLPLQSIHSEQTVLRQLDSTTEPKNIDITITGINDDNLSLPSSSSSTVQTPDAITPTKDVPKTDGGSPIMRGLKSVLNMFRSSQSPIPPAEENSQQECHVDANVQQNDSNISKPHVLASTPIAMHKEKEHTGSKRSSPYKESIVFNDDLEKELLWKDETTIFFSHEKIPVHKLFLQNSKNVQKSEQISEGHQIDSLNNTVEYMDVSYNASGVKDLTMTETGEVIKNEINPGNDSDSEFVDCETTFLKNEAIDLDNNIDTQLIDQNLNPNKVIEDRVLDNKPETSVVSEVQIKIANDMIDSLDVKLEKSLTGSKIIEVVSPEKLESQSNMTHCDQPSSDITLPSTIITTIPTDILNLNNGPDIYAEYDLDSLESNLLQTNNIAGPTSIVTNTINKLLESEAILEGEANEEGFSSPADVPLPDDDDNELLSITADAVHCEMAVRSTSIVKDSSEDVVSIPNTNEVVKNDEINSSVTPIEPLLPCNEVINDTMTLKSNHNETDFTENILEELSSQNTIDMTDKLCQNTEDNVVNDEQTALEEPIKLDLTINDVGMPKQNENILPTVMLAKEIKDEIVSSMKNELTNETDDLKEQTDVKVDKGLSIMNLNEHDVESLIEGMIIQQNENEKNNSSCTQVQSTLPSAPLTSQCIDNINIEIEASGASIGETNPLNGNVSLEQKCLLDMTYDGTVGNVDTIAESALLETSALDTKLNAEFCNNEVKDEPVTEACLQNITLNVTDNFGNPDDSQSQKLESLPLESQIINSIEDKNVTSNLKDQTFNSSKIDQAMDVTMTDITETADVIHTGDNIAMNVVDCVITELDGGITKTEVLNVTNTLDANMGNSTFDMIPKEDMNFTQENILGENNTAVIEEQAINQKLDCDVDNNEIDLNKFTLDDEIILSENNSPYVSVAADLDKVHEDANLDAGDKIDATNITAVFSTSPPITSKGYNFNFDDIEDPFATKTKIRTSASPERPHLNTELLSNNTFEKIDGPKKVSNNDRRKSHMERKKPNAIKKKLNKTFSGSFDKTEQEMTTKTEKTVKEIQKQSSGDYVDDKLIFDADDKQKQETVNAEIANIMSSDGDNISSNDTSKPTESTDTVPVKDTSLSEQSIDNPVGTSSSETIKSRNVFNLPEIDDINFNPFSTKSKIRQSPPPILDDEDPFVTRSKMVTTPDSSMIKHSNTETEKTYASEDNIETINRDSTDKMDTEPMEKDSTINKSHETTSNSSNKDTTIREINTEDEDTIEGPFLEAEELLSDKEPCLGEGSDNMIQFNDILVPESDDNAEGELFIDAQAFEFLLNQNKTNIVSDSGKESLFLKFDPLFAKRISSDGVAAALNKVQKRQSTPIKIMKHKNSVLPDPGPSTSDVTFELNKSSDIANEDANITIIKPMMVVTPAVNPTVMPRKSVTPTRTNRRSFTFTSPAMAVIDRLLSLSANNSVIENDATFSLASREQDEADIALAQLRNLLAEKEEHVYNLKTESKDLRDRLTAMETHMGSLEAESQQRLKKINELTETLSEKTKMNKSMAAVVEEYERTIASLIAETEQDKKRHAEERIALRNDRDEQTAHLASMEVSFNDLHSKYEKSKQVILSYKANEETYKVSLKNFEDNFSKVQKNYELLKQHATSKLNHANEELQKLNKAHEAEVLKLNAMLKRKDLDIKSLEESLAQKTKANEELTAICDELINKVG